mmetsp:Transcript_18331/g.55183  ORF Transcript_18331/g.55183 Transcript_18331/m.55183 type:complete len:275 (-) Transcript_18331:6374-7198(-)
MAPRDTRTSPPTMGRSSARSTFTLASRYPVYRLRARSSRLLTSTWMDGGGLGASPPAGFICICSCRRVGGCSGRWPRTLMWPRRPTRASSCSTRRAPASSTCTVAATPVTGYRRYGQVKEPLPTVRWPPTLGASSRPATLRASRAEPPVHCRSGVRLVTIIMPLSFTSTLTSSASPLPSSVALLPSSDSGTTPDTLRCPELWRLSAGASSSPKSSFWAASMAARASAVRSLVVPMAPSYSRTLTSPSGFAALPPSLPRRYSKPLTGLLVKLLML